MDHWVRLYQETDDLAHAVAEYVGEGLRRGEACIVVAVPQHRRAFMQRLDGAKEALDEGSLNLLDAERTLARFTVNGMPQWHAFQRVMGGLIAELRLQYPTVRAYGEMVDVLWQRGARDAALRLEEYWNELGRLQTFSLLCASRIDPLDSRSYGGALECVCRTHTQLIPVRDTQRFDDAVSAAAAKVLDERLSQALPSLAANHGAATQMPRGQAALFWLHQNMPQSAERILTELRAEASRAA